MEKFILSLTKENDKTILSVHNTKAEAITEGESIIKRLPVNSGLLTVIYSEIDENNNLIGKNYKLYYSWI